MHAISVFIFLLFGGKIDYTRAYCVIGQKKCAHFISFLKVKMKMNVHLEIWTEVVDITD